MEKLENCPNCGGILNDFGKCQFCGSKVYDFCDIDLRTTISKSGSASHIKRGKTYIRILTDNQVILAPIITSTANVDISFSSDSWPLISVEFAVSGEITMQEVQNG